MPDEIKVGDRVKVTSDGPEMVVESVKDGWAVCRWFKKTTETFHKDEFPTVILKIYQKPPLAV